MVDVPTETSNLQGMTSPIAQQSLLSGTGEQIRALRALVAALGADEARTRFSSAKALRAIAAEKPEAVYPFFDDFVRLLAHPNKILQWEGSLVLSHLARVDRENKFKPVFKRYFAPITGPIMISAANAIIGAGRIAVANPELADRIAAELLKVQNANYATPECRNVAIGHAITALGEFFHLLRKPQLVLEFVRVACHNSRPATARKAARLLAKIETAARQSGTGHTSSRERKKRGASGV